ncbi:hypothetical protein AB7340_20250 [Providencia alcalifaciens]
MNNPKLIVVPFAEDGQKDEIPVTREPSMPTQKATWDLGFPPATMLPESAGGLPPRGRDFNGIFNQISEMLVHFSKGGRIKFSESYAEEIGGYQKGAILQSDDETKDYQSLIDENKVNFNTASSAQINAAWKLVSTASLATDVSNKLDKTAVLQTTGNSKTGVMSQDATTTEINRQFKIANDNANGRVPSSRKVNNKPLSTDITLNAADVGSYTKADVNALILANGGIGVGQEWQNVTNSRSLGSTYTNSTGKPILISVSPNGWSDRYIGFDGFINNIKVAVSVGYGANSKPQLSFIVPNGATYRVNYSAGVETSGINLWTELR